MDSPSPGLSTLLKDALEQQTKEREAVGSHTCLFCPQVIESNWFDFISHMHIDHGFKGGDPRNLVYIAELIEELRRKMEALECIYCGGTFKSYAILRQHMRKKKHLKLNAKNAAYDKYFIVSYILENEGKKFPERSQEEAASSGEEEETGSGSFDDWSEPFVTSCSCFFCDELLSAPSDLFLHLSNQHKFDILQMKKQWDLSFYNYVVLVNFLRKMRQEVRCINCSAQFGCLQELQHHMDEQKHFVVTRDAPFWTDPTYYQPTIEHDPLLVSIPGSSSSSEDESEHPNKPQDEKIVNYVFD